MNANNGQLLNLALMMRHIIAFTDPNCSYDLSVSDEEAYKDQIQNLTLYMSYIQKKFPAIWLHMNKKFSGLPGYSDKIAEYTEDSDQHDKTTYTFDIGHSGFLYG